MHACVPRAAQAFKSYDEAGAVRRVQCLKYLVLASMLMESAVDPFDAQEAAPYKQDPEVTLIPPCLPFPQSITGSAAASTPSATAPQSVACFTACKSRPCHAGDVYLSGCQAAASA